jgi:transcription initiation factor TFIID TATA-box-binding protein
MRHGDTVATIEVQNIVASGRIADSLDLQALSLSMDDQHVTYKPEQFPGLVFRMKKPKVAILLFSTGKIVCTGAKSVEQAKEAVKSVAVMAAAAGAKVRGKLEVEVQNIVATADLKAVFDLSMIATALLAEGVEYEPEQFPGLVYRLKEPKAVILVFQSGKVVCTGTRTLEDAALAVDRFLDAVKGLY